MSASNPLGHPSECTCERCEDWRDVQLGIALLGELKSKKGGDHVVVVFVEGDGDVDSSKTRPQRSPKTSSPYKICSHCRQKLARGANFCTHCGTPAAAVSCSFCGAGNRPGGCFCTKCGRVLPAL